MRAKKQQGHEDEGDEIGLLLAHLVRDNEARVRDGRDVCHRVIEREHFAVCLRRPRFAHVEGGRRQAAADADESMEPEADGEPMGRGFNGRRDEARYDE